MALKALPDKVLLSSLETSLANLRQRWSQPWPGLPLVFERCWQQLGHAENHPNARTAALMALGRSITEAIESDGQRRAVLGCEPAYHNRLHMADTMVCLTVLLMAQRTVVNANPATTLRHERLALLAMLAHDLLHDGGVNRFPAEMESRSAHALLPVMQQHALSERDQHLVSHLILSTDAQAVRAAHERVADRPFSIDDVDCLTVLIQEADVLASTLPGTGLELTRCLAKEWERSNPAAAPGLITPAGRLHFLERAALFSSPASRRLGVQSVRQAEMEALRRQLAN